MRWSSRLQRKVREVKGKVGEYNICSPGMHGKCESATNMCCCPLRHRVELLAFMYVVDFGVLTTTRSSVYVYPARKFTKAVTLFVSTLPLFMASCDGRVRMHADGTNFFCVIYCTAFLGKATTSWRSAASWRRYTA